MSTQLIMNEAAEKVMNAYRDVGKLIAIHFDPRRQASLTAERKELEVVCIVGMLTILEYRSKGQESPEKLAGFVLKLLQELQGMQGGGI